jgi:hypothetical protein
MAQALPFETRGGSPTVVEVRTPDGQLWRLKIAVSLMSITHTPEMPNPVDPTKPTFQISLAFPIETEKVEGQ